MYNASTVRHTGPQTFSEIKNTFAGAQGDQHIQSSALNGLHIRAQSETSLVDFLAGFRNKDALDHRATTRMKAIDDIKKAIDAECGVGMGERAFKDATGEGKEIRKLTKDDLRHLGDAIERLQKQDQTPANQRLGNETINSLFDKGVRQGHLDSAKEITETTKNELKTRMTKAVMNLPAGATVDQYIRAARNVLLEYGLECELKSRVPDESSEEYASGHASLADLMKRLSPPDGSLQNVPLAMVDDAITAHGGISSGCLKQLEDVQWALTRTPPVRNQSVKWETQQTTGTQRPIQQRLAQTYRQKNNNDSSNQPVLPQKQAGVNVDAKKKREEALQTLHLDPRGTPTTAELKKEYEDLKAQHQLHVRAFERSEELLGQTTHHSDSGPDATGPALSLKENKEAWEKVIPDLENLGLHVDQVSTFADVESKFEELLARFQLQSEAYQTLLGPST